jgi:hypothetical protein
LLDWAAEEADDVHLEKERGLITSGFRAAVASGETGLLSGTSAVDRSTDDADCCGSGLWGVAGTPAEGKRTEDRVSAAAGSSAIAMRGMFDTTISRAQNSSPAATTSANIAHLLRLAITLDRVVLNKLNMRLAVCFPCGAPRYNFLTVNLPVNGAMRTSYSSPPAARTIVPPVPGDWLEVMVPPSAS